MIKDYLNNNTIAVNQTAADKNEAIRKAGELLVKLSLIDPKYIDEMIRTVDELGPYMVLSPRIAFAHAKPSKLVLEDCISMITLKTPVEFGHKKNDPVSILFVIACKESRHHLSVMRDVSKLICRDDFVKTVTSAGSVQEIVDYINR